MSLNPQNFSDMYSVRRLSDADVSMIYALCLTNPQYYEFCAMQTSPEDIRNDLHIAPPGIDLSDKYFVGFFDGGTLIAVMDLIDGYPNKGTAFIGFFMMDAAAQGKGTGSAIVNDVFKFLKKSGFAAVRLGIYKSNPQGMRFWQKNGFAFLEEIPQENGIIVRAERIL